MLKLNGLENVKLLPNELYQGLLPSGSSSLASSSIAKAWHSSCVLRGLRAYVIHDSACLASDVSPGSCPSIRLIASLYVLLSDLASCPSVFSVALDLFFGSLVKQRVYVQARQKKPVGSTLVFVILNLCKVHVHAIHGSSDFHLSHLVSAPCHAECTLADAAPAQQHIVLHLSHLPSLQA